MENPYKNKMKKIYIPHDRIVQTFSVCNQPGIVYTARRTYVRIIPGGECKWTKNGAVGNYEILPVNPMYCVKKK